MLKKSGMRSLFRKDQFPFFQEFTSKDCTKIMLSRYSPLITDRNVTLKLTPKAFPPRKLLDEIIKYSWNNFISITTYFVCQSYLYERLLAHSTRRSRTNSRLSALAWSSRFFARSRALRRHFSNPRGWDSFSESPPVTIGSGLWENGLY